jgi:hypothetical protein
VPLKIDQSKTADFEKKRFTAFSLYGSLLSELFVVGEALWPLV